MRKPNEYRRSDKADSGPVALQIIAKHYKKEYTVATIRNLTHAGSEGATFNGLQFAAAEMGFEAQTKTLTWQDLKNEQNLPCILAWNNNSSFVVCKKIFKDKSGNFKISVADTASENQIYDETDFLKCWLGTTNLDGNGLALTLTPGKNFETIAQEKKKRSKNLKFFVKYFKPYKTQILQLIVALFLGSILQMFLPFLTQALVDIGINGKNLNFITIVLIAQIIFLLSQTAVGFMRSWVMLQVNTRINIWLISDFLAKLMSLPLNYFDSKRTGDIMQRIGDHRRIKDFLMGTSINILFSGFTFIVFSIILCFYNYKILLVFLFGNSLYVFWVLMFMKRRKALDIKRFNQSAAEQSQIIQIVEGMQEIKLSNCENQKLEGWQKIQTNLFDINLKSLNLGQMQRLGTVFFNQSTSIVISYMAAKSVVNGDMTLGMMMSMTYIIGQLTHPVSEFIDFSQNFQDAKISLERLNEIHSLKDETEDIDKKLNSLPENKDIKIENLCFSYSGFRNEDVLHNINLNIPAGKTTAIVGPSGSGKTTIAKLILGFYPPTEGKITIGDVNVSDINPQVWRNSVRSVLQDSFIFSDTIENNIAVGCENIDYQRLYFASEAAACSSFIENLPMKYKTPIGMSGTGLSQGQKQRILIARVIYKNPEIIIFDEATNSLDTINEKTIMENLNKFYANKTAIVIAHRLSTIKNADNIVVINKGEIVEQGKHDFLMDKKGFYYTLVINQLGKIE